MNHEAPHRDCVAEVFAAFLGEICIHTLLAPDRPLKWTIIANLQAGGFIIPARWKRHQGQLARSVEKAHRNPRRVNAFPSSITQAMEEGKGSLGKRGLIPTEGPGHAGRVTRSLIAAVQGEIPVSSGQQAPLYLIITAGGDGTSREVLTALYALPLQFRSYFVVLRLPMGTGNDGADAWELDKALDLLLYPSRIEMAGALRLTTATGKGPFYAFNILSLGLDAFVTHMTNKMKRFFPGDSYKLWVDIASLLYDRLYRVGPMEIRASDEAGNTFIIVRECILLLAMGVSGRRTYGSHKWILPDDRNVCAVKQMSLFRKLRLKGLFTTGKHIDKPEAILFTAHRVAVQGSYPLLAQMDGETVLLQPEDFPGCIERTEAAIPVLKGLSGLQPAHKG
ncbi:MAG: diacylglycerol kinase [Treponema sp.]|jgi:diacylglycerol kinase family enzyme|nr:diacylglycerol kinase [Treponema sp.]